MGEAGPRLPQASLASRLRHGRLATVQGQKAPRYPLDMSEDEAIRHYLEMVNRIPPLTDREVRELARTVQRAGDTDDLAPVDEVAAADAELIAARKRLIEGNLQTVAAIADDYRNQVPLSLDLLQAGNDGLARVVNVFDGQRSAEFQDRAAAAIRDAVTAALSGRA